MRMRPMLVALSTLAVAAVLTACGPRTTPAPSVAPTGTIVSPTSTTAPPDEPAAIVVSVDGLTLVNADGATLDEVDFTDGAGTLAFLGEHLGSTPEPTEALEGYSIKGYDWGDVLLSVLDDGPASISFGAAEVNGLALRTRQDVQVGWTRDEVEPIADDPDYDGDGDGKSDFLRLEVRDAPGTKSLEKPEEVGVQFIMLVIEHDEVTRIISPADDFSDV